MRAYFFCNQYLSSIQNGIQAAHCVSEMFVKYNDGPAPLLCLWAKRHKTMILLNGGYSSNLEEITKFFARKQNPFPWAKFREEKASLNGTMTCVGIILPAKIYDAAKKWRMSISQDEKEDALMGFSAWEVCLTTDVLNQYSLAH